MLLLSVFANRITLGHKQFYKLQTFLQQDQKDLNRSDQHSGAKNLSKVFDAFFDFCIKFFFSPFDKFVLRKLSLQGLNDGEMSLLDLDLDQVSVSNEFTLIQFLTK
jgi:hypothetical protein